VVVSSQMIFNVTAKRLISYNDSNSEGELWMQFEAFLQGLISFPLHIPGTSFYKSMQVIKKYRYRYILFEKIIISGVGVQYLKFI
jgi:hypothetical protein